MSTTLPIDDDGAFAAQAAISRQMGSEFVARVLDAGLRQLRRAPRSARLIETWPGDRRADAVALRFNSALHALARRQATPALADLYRTLDGDFDATIGEVLAQDDAFIAGWLEHAPQTNEVGRAAAIWAALGEVAAQFDRPINLLEIGSSAGLNLNIARYGFDLDGIVSGDLASPVQLRPVWSGPPPSRAKVDIRSARGVDIDPLNVADLASRERLLSFVWADDRPRTERLAAAIALAETHPVRIDRADAVEWIAARLAEPQDAGTTRAVFHSIVLQYLPPAGREAVAAAIARAGKHADSERPLAWISFEWDSVRAKVALTLTMWPGGLRRELATCQAHAAWIDWNG